ncbi:MAG: hypothetical protein KDE20_15965, partial [Caldilineaceae bacterium]|nr:hypothetical protein [Caldilineaceae bacterium]
MFQAVAVPILVIAQILGAFFVSSAHASAAATSLATAQWWDNTRDYRVQVSVEAGGSVRVDRPVDVSLNFTDLLQSMGVSDPFDEKSVRVVEVDIDGNLVDGQTAFQFDKDTGYDKTTNAAGTLVIMLAGQTASNASRFFQIYFDREGKGLSAPVIPVQVDFAQTGITDAGSAAYRIATPNGTYFYHTIGGGFSSLDDADGNDWIGFSTTEDEAFRGIPNMIHPESGFHPGRTGSVTSLVNKGPLKVTFESTYGSGADEWRARWEIYPTFARMTLLQAGHDYWFLYEGTPGGALDAADYWVRSDGISGTAFSTGASRVERWCRDTDNAVNWQTVCNNQGGAWAEEWAYFVDPNVGASGRGIYVAHHDNDSVVDSYRRHSDPNWPMTIFGFGRLDDSEYFPASGVNKQFSFGLLDDIDFADAALRIRSNVRDVVVTVGSAETSVPTAIVSDRFNSCTLDTDLWLFVDPQSGTAGASSLRMTGSAAEISVPAGTAHGIQSGPMSAPQLIQTVGNGDFSVDVHFTSLPQQAGQMLGIVAVQDADDRIYVNYVRNETELHLVAGHVVAGVLQAKFDVSIPVTPPPGFL